MIVLQKAYGFSLPEYKPVHDSMSEKETAGHR